MAQRFLFSGAHGLGSNVVPIAVSDELEHSSRRR